ncbi:MAG: hypothetical protein KIT09_19785 [Bryobacteraceae bacterium]|nr:hypothetical protein [Bryobacteraceae bacterium]
MRPNQVPETEFRGDEDPKALGRLGEELVRKYMDEAAPLVQPAAVELDVAGEIGGVQVCGKRRARARRSVKQREQARLVESGDAGQMRWMAASNR